MAQRLAAGEPLHMVVATDGSPSVQTTATLASDLARTFKAQVTVLAALRQDEGPVRSKEVLDQALELLGELEPAPQTVVLRGNADEVIVEYLTQTPVDLLILGAFRDRGVTQFMVGATVERLVRHAPTSILVVKGRPPAFSKLLVSAEVGDDIVLDAAIQWARVLNAKLQLLHVILPTAAMYLTLPDVVQLPLDEITRQDTPLARFVKNSVARLEAVGLDGDAVQVRRGAVPDTIFQEARAGGFDLIVVGSKSSPVRDRYFAGSIATRVVKHAHRSVLVVQTAQ